MGEQEFKTTKTQLDLCNAEAMKIINSAYAITTELGNMFQSLFKDSQSETRKIVSNWKELEGKMNMSYKQVFTSALQAIANFQKLEKNFIA